MIFFLACQSGKQRSKVIKTDFISHKSLFEHIQATACNLSIEDSIKSIRKEESIEKVHYVISLGLNGKVLYDLSLNSNLIEVDKIKPIVDFMKRFDIDYLSCNKSVFVLGYFKQSVKSDIYLYRTNNIDSIYNGSSGILKMSEMLESKDDDEWAENLGQDWYLIAIKKNL